MISFLTSSFITYQSREEYVPKPMDDSNGFADNLKKYWVENSKFLVFTSDPSDYKMTDHLLRELSDAFSLKDFSISEMKTFDYRAIEEYEKNHKGDKATAAKNALKEAMDWADVIFLAGGHVPTENAFMKLCGMKELLQEKAVFDGILIGLSAGSVNMAKQAYLLPEREGESVSPDYIRFTDGLGLTTINMIPHSVYEKTVILDGKKLIDDIVASDSENRDFYLVEDGSYFIIRNGITEFFGSGEIMKNGVLRPLHEGIINSDNWRFIKDEPALATEEFKYFRAIISNQYEFVFELDTETDRIEFFHVSKQMLASLMIPIHYDTFAELNEDFSKKLVVEEEKQPYLEQIAISVILDELYNKKSYVRTVHINDGNGVRAVSIRVNPIEGYNHRLLVCFSDISMILDHDWMTDEYSRSGFISMAERLLKEPEYSEGYSLVYTNIQGFKAINDLMGTFSGDMVIFMERDILVRELQPVLIARLESDHFALITRTDFLTHEKMESVCHQCYEEESKRLPFLIRCGIYRIRNTEKKIQHMLDRAKLAENAISSDRGEFYAFCNEQMKNDYVLQRVLISELDDALEREEFVPYYQPVVDTRTGEIVSAEALIRWKHGTRGMISPGLFVPVFEKEGLITKIDSFMVAHILRFNRKRLQSGKRVVPCAVNLSRVDFYDTNLMEIIRRQLKKEENSKNMLKLEVTESAYAVLESDAISFLDELKAMGLSLMLDDFGSGMSSLSTLESFEFDVIKLDMGFISQIGKNAKAEAIIKHTVGLSHDIGAKVVAEGVETEKQYEFLKAIGCDMIQGYYFYKPMPEEEFEKLL